MLRKKPKTGSKPRRELFKKLMRRDWLKKRPKKKPKRKIKPKNLPRKSPKRRPRTKPSKKSWSLTI